MHTLTRIAANEHGIFSEFRFDGEPKIFMHTLEHAYENLDGSFSPKVPPGIYECIRGWHSLHDGKRFETFEVMGVEGHSGILFHVGNFNIDSEGCMLCGKLLNQKTPSMVSLSRNTFNEFMQRLDGVDKFPLAVI